jgi:hypothetical protein
VTWPDAGATAAAEVAAASKEIINRRVSIIQVSLRDGSLRTMPFFGAILATTRALRACDRQAINRLHLRRIDNLGERGTSDS